MKQRQFETLGGKLRLWFDVESKYEATPSECYKMKLLLWFDVESKYEATVRQRIEDAG